MDNSLKTIEDFIQTGLAERFFKVFGTPLLFYNGPDVKTVAAKMLKERGMPQYPFAVAKTTNWAITENTYKPHTMLRRGLKGRSSDDYVLAYELNMIPVTTSYEITFYVQGFKPLRVLGKTWLMAATRNNLKFSVTYAVRDVDINVKMEPTFQVPERDGGTTEVKEYVAVTNMTVEGYMGDQLKTTQAATSLEVQIQALEAVAATGAQVTVFSKGWPSAARDSVVEPSLVVLNQQEPSYTYEHSATAAYMWSIVHNLGKFPDVLILDQNGQAVNGTVNYPSNNQVVISFYNATKGKAFLT